MTEETKEAFAVVVNTDLTEGRGSNYVKNICELEATAVRLARKADVQGTDGTVMRVTLIKRNATWFGPIQLVYSSEDDRRMQTVMNANRAAEEKARNLGLTDEDLAALRRLP